jgi:hypothetical protein
VREARQRRPAGDAAVARDEVEGFDEVVHRVFVSSPSRVPTA